MPANAPTQSIGIHSVGLIGARGYVGLELLALLESHPLLDLAYASSRALAGEPISKHAKASFSGKSFEELSPSDIASENADIVILALPDAAADPFLEAIEASETKPKLILDLSSDHRFTDDWTYGLSEHNRAQIIGASRISNPGCYATAAQIALRPILPLLAELPHCFGVSGYSGAGTKRTSRNDHRALHDDLLPYKLVNHTHEREISRHLGTPVRFSPHVVSFFRGIALTVHAKLTNPIDAPTLAALYHDIYDSCELIKVLDDEMPRVRSIVNRDGALVGGFSINPERPDEIAVVCTIDNLRKGAATQAIQNINLALWFDEFIGLRTLTGPHAEPIE